MKQDSKKLIPYISPVVEVIEYKTEDGFASPMLSVKNFEEFSELKNSDGDNTYGGEWLDILGE